MPTFTTRDGTSIFYKDWGPSTGPIIIFSHGWPLSADDWEAQMFFFGSKGYRCIAHDRRGHGRSSQPWHGNDMDTYADDLYQLVEHLDLKNATAIGHSTGGGEVTRLVGRYGTSRVKKLVLVSAIPPLMLKTAANPGGLPMEVFDQFREGIVKDRSQFFIDVPTGPFFGYNRPGAKVSEGQIRAWWLQGMMASFKGVYDCVKVFSETDCTEDLKGLDIPVLVIHGDDDQIVPFADSGPLSAKLAPKGTLKVYKGGAHALPHTEPERLNQDILKFLES